MWADDEPVDGYIPGLLIINQIGLVQQVLYFSLPVIIV